MTAPELTPAVTPDNRSLSADYPRDVPPGHSIPAPAPARVPQRRLGASRIEVPAIGIGTLAWGEKRFGYGTTHTRDDLFAAYQTFLDTGYNYFDTSDSYGKGMSEQLLGEFRRQDGRPIIVGTKYTPAKPYDPSMRLSANGLMGTLEGSLRRLQEDTVDLYQIHYPPARRRLHAYLDALAETVKTGKAKAVGVSNFSVDLMRRSHDYLGGQGIPLASNQIGYSLLDRYPETTGMLAACAELDIALIAILPLAQGVLTGKYRPGGERYPSLLPFMLRGAKIAESETPLRRRFLRRPYELHREQLEPLFDVMSDVARAHEASIAQVALNWLIQSDPLVIPIPGPKNVTEARENAATLTWQLTHEEFRLLDQTEADVRKSLTTKEPR